ncbi:MAG TPA: alpha/beta hydrolase [Burkholderiales bacterium]|nr:alpha/beta hydrolase [Burkholderiales bacterium]
MAERLAGSFRVLAVDLSGQGKMTWPAAGGDALEEDLQLLETIAGEAPLHLVGHSYGGAVALRFALRHAGRVRSLALYEPAAWSLLPDPEIVERANFIASAAEAGDRRAAARAFVDFWNGAGSWERMSEFHRERLAAQVPQVVAHFTALFADRTTPRDYASFSMPALVRCGTSGPECGPRIARLLADTLPRAELRAFPGLGHMGPMRSPDEVNPALERFLLRRLRSASGRASRPARRRSDCARTAAGSRA